MKTVLILFSTIVVIIMSGCVKCDSCVKKIKPKVVENRCTKDVKTVHYSNRCDYRCGFPVTVRKPSKCNKGVE